MRRKLFLSSSFIVFVFIMLGNMVSGQELKYPTKPIQVIIPYGPGGTNDIIARAVDSQLQEVLKTPIIHINKTGGSGILAAAFVKEEKPDGYTILQGGLSVNIEIPIITPNCPYNLQDFIPIARTAYGPLVLLVKKNAPWDTLESFLVEAKKEPKKISLGIPGIGTSQHYVTKLFESETKIEFNIIPFKGDSANITALLGGHLQASVAGLTAATPYLKAEDVKALASSGYDRHPLFKDIPLFREKGLPEVTLISWGGPFVRAGTPDYVVRILDGAFREAAVHPSVISILEKAGVAPGYLGSDELKKLVPSEYNRLLKAAKLAGLIK